MNMSYFVIDDSVSSNFEKGINIISNGDSLLLYELDQKANNGKTYEIIDASGELSASGAIVLNNIPISEDGRAAFEERFLGRARAIEETRGFIAIKVLRPLNDDVYVVLTQWETEQAFKDWQTSSAYSKAHKKTPYF